MSFIELSPRVEVQPLKSGYSAERVVDICSEHTGGVYHLTEFLSTLTSVPRCHARATIVTEPMAVIADASVTDGAVSNTCFRQ